jgi:hypothetical protein
MEVLSEGIGELIGSPFIPERTVSLHKQTAASPYTFLKSRRVRPPAEYLKIPREEIDSMGIVIGK